MIELLCAGEPRDPLRSRSVVMNDRREGSFIPGFFRTRMNEIRFAHTSFRIQRGFPMSQIFS
jgi:hypothetical protein